MLLLAAYLLLAAVCCAVWYWVSLQRHRRRATEVTLWIQSALSGQGQVGGIRWLAPSRFKVPLSLTCGVFHRAWVLIDMLPSEFPLRWLSAKLHRRRELFTFQADLDLPPAFSLHVQNLRWFARSSRKAHRRENGWTIEQAGPFIISTRNDWKKEISCAMGSLARGDHEFSSIDFQRRSPHFSVSLPLDAIAPGTPTQAFVFESMRELASSSSASLS
jgi:hypothetical protein